MTGITGQTVEGTTVENTTVEGGVQGGGGGPTPPASGFGQAGTWMNESPEVTLDLSSQMGDPVAIYMTQDGSMVFAINRPDAIVYRYTLSTPFDLSSGSFDTGQTFDASTQADAGLGISLSADGTKMFVRNFGPPASVFEYDLSTPWDLTTATYNSNNLALDGGGGRGLKISSDGTRMGVAEQDGTVDVYTLSTPWDITTGTRDSTSTPLTIGGAPQVFGLAFSNDGDALFLVFFSNDTIFQMDLPAAYDVPNATFPELYGSIGTLAVFGGTTGSNEPADLMFNDDMTRVYVLLEDFHTIYQASIPAEVTSPPVLDIAGLTVDSSFSFTSSENQLLGGHVMAGQSIVTLVGNQNDLAYRVVAQPGDYAEFVRETGGLSTSTQDSIMTGVWMSPDATMLFALGLNTDSVYRYTLPNPIGVATGSFDTGQVLDVQADEGLVEDLWLSPDGTMVYVVGRQMDAVQQYELSTPFDLTTAGSASSFDISPQTVVPTGITMSHDGSRGYIIDWDSTNNRLEQYNLGTPFDWTTAVHDKTLFLGGIVGNPSVGLSVSSEGDAMYVFTSNDNRVTKLT